jgi:hypothetical protein
MARFWLSWHQPTNDSRPLTYPPNQSVLGWWESGLSYEVNDDGDEVVMPVLCAIVDAIDEQGAKASVLIDWPEAEGWRFVVPLRGEWSLSDRFPLADWMIERLGGVNDETSDAVYVAGVRRGVRRNERASHRHDN